MLRLTIASALACLLLVPPSGAQSKHYGKIGELTVTATGVTATPAHDADDHYIAIFVRIRQGGTDTACATISAKLKGTDSVEYSELTRLPSDARWPDRPRISRMLHGQESTGAYVFEMKSGVDPLELALRMDSPSTDCNASEVGGVLADAPAAETTLDVHDLSAVKIADNDLTGLPASGARGYSMPLCLYCPRAPYPREAMKAKIEGIVELVAVVTADGYATNIQVKKSVGYGLDEAAVQTIRTWRFTPAVGPDGNPTAVRQVIEMTFTLHSK